MKIPERPVGKQDEFDKQVDLLFDLLAVAYQGIRTALDLNVDLAAFLLNDYSHLQLFRLVNQEPPDVESHSAQVRHITELLFYGMRT